MTAPQTALETVAPPAVTTPSRTGRPGLRVMALIVCVAFGTFILGSLLVRDLFIGTEARSFLFIKTPFDLARFFVLPAPSWGNNRQLGIAFFRATGVFCTTDTPCVNTAGLALTSVTVSLLIAHTWQLLRSVALTIPVAIVWVLSAPLLNAWMWQATWFDLLAVCCAMLLGGYWWWTFGRERVSPAGGVVFGLVSCALLALAFNAKELMYLYVGVLPIIAVLRSRPGTVRRNLLLCAIPFAYGVWFVGYAVTHIDPGYARQVGGADLLDGLRRLTVQTLGIDHSFMSLTPSAQAGGNIKNSAIDLYLLFAVALVVAFLLSARRARRPHGPIGVGRVLEVGRAWSVELYLSAVAVVSIVLAARSQGVNAYYALLPWWALLTLVVALLHRWRAAPAIVILLIGTMLAWIGLVMPGSVPRNVLDESRRLTDSGVAVRVLLRDRVVKRVTWRAEGPPFADFYLLRDYSKPSPWQVGSEFWPWFTRGRLWLPVSDLQTGTAAEILADLGAHAAPGETVVVLDDTYQLELLAFEGKPLYVAPKVLAPPPSPTPAPGTTPSPGTTPGPASSTAPGTTSPAATPAAIPTPAAVSPAALPRPSSAPSTPAAP